MLDHLQRPRLLRFALGLGHEQPLQAFVILVAVIVVVVGVALVKSLALWLTDCVQGFAMAEKRHARHGAGHGR